MYKRQPNKLARLIEEIDHEDAKLVACLVEDGNLSGGNNLVRSRVSAKPTLNTGSVVQMRKLLYDVLELPVRLVNPVTAKERESNKLLAHVIMNHKREWAGYDTDPIPCLLYTSICDMTTRPYIISEKLRVGYANRLDAYFDNTIEKVKQW